MIQINTCIKILENERSPDTSLNRGFVIYYDDLYNDILCGLEIRDEEKR